MIGAFIGNPIGAPNRLSDVIVEIVGTSSGTSTVSGVGRSTASSVGSSTGTATVTSVGAGVIGVVGSSAGAATVAAFGQPIFAAVGTAFGSSVVTGIAIILPITSRNVLQDPVDCVMAGNQRKFKTGRAHFGALRGIFRE